MKAAQGAEKAADAVADTATTAATSKLGKVAEHGKQVGEPLAQEAAGVAIAVDPFNEDRLTTMLIENPALRNPVTEYMGTNHPDDPAWEGRFKNVLDAIPVAYGAEVASLLVKAPVSYTHLTLPTILLV